MALFSPNAKLNSEKNWAQGVFMFNQGSATSPEWGFKSLALPILFFSLYRHHPPTDCLKLAVEVHTSKWYGHFMDLHEVSKGYGG